MKTVSEEFVQELIDFAPDSASAAMGFAQLQMEGTVAAFNILARNRAAYLADEVGMGKTYVALGVMALFRHLDPQARIVVIAPRENIQRKWIKELRNFVRVNWKVVGNRVKSIQGGPAWEPVYCGSLRAARVRSPNIRNAPRSRRGGPTGRWSRRDTNALRMDEGSGGRPPRRSQKTGQARARTRSRPRPTSTSHTRRHDSLAPAPRDKGSH